MIEEIVEVSTQECAILAERCVKAGKFGHLKASSLEEIHVLLESFRLLQRSYSSILGMACEEQAINGDA